MKDNSDFAVPQGGFDRAEVAEMLGLYILHCLRHLPVILAIYKGTFGLFWSIME